MFEKRPRRTVEDFVDALLGLVLEGLALRVLPPVPGHLAHGVRHGVAVLIEVVGEGRARVVDLDAGLARGADSTVAARLGGRRHGRANDDARLAALRVLVADVVALGDAPRPGLVGRLGAFRKERADVELIGVDLAVVVHVAGALGLAILQPVVRGVLASKDDRERGGEQQDGLHCRFGWRSLRVAPAAGARGVSIGGWCAARAGATRGAQHRQARVARTRGQEEAPMAAAHLKGGGNCVVTIGREFVTGGVQTRCSTLGIPFLEKCRRAFDIENALDISYRANRSPAPRIAPFPPTPPARPLHTSRTSLLRLLSRPSRTGRRQARAQAVASCSSSASRKVSIGGHEHTRLRSPYVSFRRDVVGQNFVARSDGSGYTAFVRE